MRHKTFYINGNTGFRYESRIFCFKVMKEKNQLVLDEALSKVTQKLAITSRFCILSLSSLFLKEFDNLILAADKLHLSN